jgi:hypothetical protein
MFQLLCNWVYVNRISCSLIMVKIGYSHILFPEVNISIMQLMKCTVKEKAKFKGEELHIASLQSPYREVRVEI